MKRIFALLTAAVLSAAVLSGCGTSQGANAGGSSSGVQSATTESTMSGSAKAGSTVAKNAAGNIVSGTAAVSSGNGLYADRTSKSAKTVTSQRALIRKATYEQMLRNGYVHDKDGYLLDYENSVTPGTAY